MKWREQNKQFILRLKEQGIKEISAPEFLMAARAFFSTKDSTIEKRIDSMKEDKLIEWDGLKWKIN